MAWNERKKQQTSRISLQAPKEISYSEMQTDRALATKEFINNSQIHNETPPFLDLNKTYNINDPNLRPIQAPKETSYSEIQTHKDLAAKGAKYTEDRREEIAAQPSLNRKDGRNDKQTLKNVKGYNQSHEVTGNIGIAKKNIVEVEGGTNIGPAPDWGSAFRGRKTQQKTVKKRQEQIQKAFEKNAPFEEESSAYTEEPASFRKKEKAHKISGVKKIKIAAPTESSVEWTPLEKAVEKYKYAKKDKNGQVIYDTTDLKNNSWLSNTAEERKRLQKEWQRKHQSDPEPGTKQEPQGTPKGAKEAIPEKDAEFYALHPNQNPNAPKYYGDLSPEQREQLKKYEEHLDNEIKKPISKEQKIENAKKYLQEQNINIEKMSNEEIMAQRKNMRREQLKKILVKNNGSHGKAAIIAGGAIGMGALVFGLSNSRGQQSNAQLYGQQPIQY